MKIAVVGSGVSGLAATWALNEHSEHEVHLYEADDRPGGHANTVEFKKAEDEEGINVDSGFIVFNPCTYPNFLRFLDLYPQIPIAKTEMTFSISRDKGAFEWAGDNLYTIFCQPKRLVDPNMWRMIYDVLRFNACARELIGPGSSRDDGQSIGEYLKRNGYSDAFSDNYLIPMTAAIWSTPPDKCALDFPAKTLVQFMHNHHLLQITGKPSWLTIPGGSHQYVKTILSKLPDIQLHLSAPVVSLSTDSSSKVTLTTASGTAEEYDHVILACHSDTVLRILRAGHGMTDDEKRILGMFQWNKNEAVLHHDVELMPKSRLAWSCWNYLSYSEVDANGKRKANCDRVALTYGMNALQHISEDKHGPVLVTLNPPFDPAPEKTLGRYQYEHPVLDGNAVRAQALMPVIQNTRSISYAGAYLKYGFHEDGFTSGLRAVERWVELPFEIMDAEGTDALESRRKRGCGVYHEGGGRIWLLVLMFDLFEMSGMRVLVGVYFSIVLFFLRTLLGIVGVDVKLD